MPPDQRGGADITGRVTGGNVIRFSTTAPDPAATVLHETFHLDSFVRGAASDALLDIDIADALGIKYTPRSPGLQGLNDAASAAWDAELEKNCGKPKP
jgi:hypothetical protein